MKSLIIGACTLSFFCITGCGNDAGEQSEEPNTNHQYVVYEFWAEWCVPCKRYEPIFEKLQAKYTRPNVTFKRVNIDEDKETPAKFDVHQIPTVVVTSDGKVVGKLASPTEKELLKVMR